MKSVAAKSSITFDNLYTLYYQKVVNYLIKVMGNDSAEDIAQETFLKVYKNLDSLKDESKLSPWLLKIALNTARDFMRKDSKIKIAANESKEYSFSAGEGLRSDIHQIDDKNAYSIEEKMQHKEMIHCYIKFVEKLPKNYYEVYVLSDFDHLSNSEISKKLSISLETVKIRLHRARTKLYDALKANCQCFQNDHGELVGELKQ